MRLVLGLILISACSSPPCDLTPLEDAPEAGPGEVRHGFAIADPRGISVIATTSGVACRTCGALIYLDSALHEQRRVDIDLDGYGEIAASNDTTIVFDRYLGPDVETYRPHFQLSALSATGHKLWHDDFAEGEAWTALVPPFNPFRPHHAVPKVAAGPESVVVYGTPLASVFDAATGELRWETPADPADAIAVDVTGGLFLASATRLAMPEATLRHLDPDGVTRWQTTWKTTQMPSRFPGVGFAGAASTADDGLIVAGGFNTATLDLGGHVLEGPTGDVGPFGPLSQNFVAALDRNGATQWAVAAGRTDQTGYVEIRQFAATSDGALICGYYLGTGQLGLPDSDGSSSVFVARVDSNGTITAYPISGDGVGSCEELAVADDGNAIVVVSVGNGEIRGGSRTFDADPRGEFFVLNIPL